MLVYKQQPNVLTVETDGRVVHITPIRVIINNSVENVLTGKNAFEFVKLLCSQASTEISEYIEEFIYEHTLLFIFEDGVDPATCLSKSTPRLES